MRSFFTLALVVVSLSFCTALAAPTPNDQIERLQELREYESHQKYFREPGTHDPGDNELLGHYDDRFFRGLLSYDDKRDAQVNMIRAYLRTFRAHGIETWVAHGTLLGWWWNGKMLPWDWDIDTQVSERTIEYLARTLNNTRYTFTAPPSELHSNPVTHTYLLDINPMWTERNRGDGLNIIDARWIDEQSGLYIDITALSETHADTLPGVWSCKNDHRYKIRDLYPLRQTMFEGVPANVPYAYVQILEEEYGKKALVTTEYEGHTWDPAAKEWVNTTCKATETGFYPSRPR